LTEEGRIKWAVWDIV